MAESVNLGRAHVEFTGDFGSLMDGIRHAVKVSAEATATIKLALSETDKQVERSNRNIIRSYAEMNRQVRSHLRKITSELVFLQLDIGHIANQFQRMSIMVSAAMAGATAASISFEDAFANVRKTVDASEAEFRALERNLRQMSLETRTGANELAVIMGVAGQLGIRGVENLTNFTRTIDQLTVATTLTGEEGAQNLARLMNIMQESMGNVDRLGAAIVDLGNNFASTETEILNMSLRIAGAGKTIGLTTPEVLALATALSDVGIRAEMGGSAISRVMINMANAVAQGGSRLREFARVANVSAQEFARIFREDPIQAIEMFIRGLERLDRQGQNVFAVLESIGASEIRVRDTLLRLFQAADRLSDAVRRSNRAWEENIALTEEFRKRNETAASQLRIAYNNIVEIVRIVGDEYNPIVKQAAQFTTNLAQAFQAMTPEQRAAVAEFGALATAILGGVSAALLATKAFITFGTGITLLARAVAALLSPWGLATIAIVTAAVVIARKWGEIRDMIAQSDLGQAARRAWESFVEVWQSDELTLPEKIVESVEIVVEGVTGLVESIIKWWLGTRITLYRKGVEMLGLDPDENALVQFLEDIKSWWDREDLVFSEKVARVTGITLGMDEETQQRFQEQVRDSVKQFSEDLKRIWGEEFGESFQEAIRSAQEEGRFFDPVTVFFERMTESVRAFRSALEPIRDVVRDWSRGVFGDIELAEAFRQGLESDLIDPKVYRAFQSFIDLGGAVGEFLMESIAAAFDLLELIEMLFLTPIAQALDPLLEAGARMAGALVGGFMRGWQELENWFANTRLGKFLIDIGFMSGPASREPTMPGLVESFQFGGLQEILDAIYRAEGGERARVPYGMTSFADRGNRFGLAKNQELFEMLQIVYGLEEGTKEFYEAAAAVSVMHYWEAFKKRFPEVADKTFNELSAEMQRRFIEFLGTSWAPPELHPLNANWVPNMLSILGIRGYNQGVILPGFGGGDRIPALLEPGEAVVPARVVQGGLDDIVAWFRRMGVRKMQTGGIAGISTLAEAEGQLALVTADMNAFASNLLSGIEEITASVSAFMFGGLEMIAEVLKTLFPSHAETIQRGLDDLRDWWQKTFAPRARDEGPAVGEPEAPVVQEITGPVTATLILPEGLQRLLDIQEFVQIQERIAAVTGEEFDALNTEIRMVREAIRQMAEAAGGEIPEEANILISRLRELEKQAEDLAIKQSMWSSALDTLRRRFEEIDSALGAVVRSIRFDAGGFKGFDLATLAAEGIAFALDTLINLFDTGASELESTINRIRNLDVGQDVLSIAQTFRNYQDVEKNRQAAIKEAERLRKLQQQIDKETAVGGLIGAGVGFLLGGFGGLLIGGLIGGGASRSQAKKKYADEIAAAEEEIRRLEGLIENARVKLIDALGIAADNFASGIQAAIERASIKGILSDEEAFSEFSRNMEEAINQVIRRGLITKFVGTVLEPQIMSLAEHIQEALLGERELDMEFVRQMQAQMTDASKELFKLMDEFDILAETTERVNRQFERLVNVPLGRRVLQALRYQSMTPEMVPNDIPHFQSGGIMPHDGYAYLHRGELVLNREQQAELFSGGGMVFTGPITIVANDPIEFERKLRDYMRRESLRRTGNPTALERVRR